MPCPMPLPMCDGMGCMLFKGTFCGLPGMPTMPCGMLPPPMLMLCMADMVLMWCPEGVGCGCALCMLLCAVELRCTWFMFIVLLLVLLGMNWLPFGFGLWLFWWCWAVCGWMLFGMELVCDSIGLAMLGLLFNSGLG